MRQTTSAHLQRCEALKEELARYHRAWDPSVTPDDRRLQHDFGRRFLELMEANENCFDRGSLPGHFTGAALVVTGDLSRVLLTHHRKLGKWLQLGGHADGNPVLHQTALREAEEESGLKELRFFPWEKALGETGPLFFDLDIHSIPARPGEPQHLHYDARYLVLAEEPEAISISEESLDLRWFALAEALEVTRERSMQRQFEKLRWLAGRYGF